MSKWRNYKHWIFDENDNHVIWPEQDNMSEKLAEMIVEQHNQSLSHLSAVNEKLIKACKEFDDAIDPTRGENLTIYVRSEAYDKWATMYLKLADEMGDNKQQ